MSGRKNPNSVRDLVNALLGPGKFSKNSLAKRIGVDPREIGRWSKGDVRPHEKYLTALRETCEHAGINWGKFESVESVYSFSDTYDRNVANGPRGLHSEARNIPRVNNPATGAAYRLFGVELNSPFGTPASTLTISSDWMMPLSRLGFDIITSKTVRTEFQPVHPYPNVVYIPEHRHPLDPAKVTGLTVEGSHDSSGIDFERFTAANSLGMPSPKMDDWKGDLARTRQALLPGQVLIASVVGTERKDGPDLASDFARCASNAWEARPHAIELNCSCINAYGPEGAIYQSLDLAERIVTKVRKEVGAAVPVIVKIGYLPPDKLAQLFKRIHRHVNGFVAINTLPAKVYAGGSQKREQIFPGDKKRLVAGLSGIVLQRLAFETVQQLAALVKEHKRADEFAILGVGGVFNAADAKQLLDAGASGVQMATAALFNPLIAVEIRHQMTATESSRVLERTGLNVPFSDRPPAEAFDRLLKVCDRGHINLDAALPVFVAKWLGPYVTELARLQSADSPVNTRREAPSEAQIEQWLRDGLG